MSSSFKKTPFKVDKTPLFYVPHDHKNKFHDIGYNKSDNHSLEKVRRLRFFFNHKHHSEEKRDIA